MKTTLYDQLTAMQSDHAASKCLISKERAWTFAEAGAQVERYAQVFEGLKIGLGARVLCVVAREEHVLFYHLAASRLGALFAPVDARAEPAKLQAIVNSYGPDLVIVSPQFDATALSLSQYELYQPSQPSLTTGDFWLRRQPLRRAGPARCPIASDVGLVFYTSGSTGESKGVALSHQNVLFAAESICEYLQINDDDLIYNALPLNFDYGYYQLLLPLFTGCATFVAKSFLIPQKNLLEIHKTKATVLPLVPSMARLIQLTGSSDVLPSVKKVTNTGEAIHSGEIGAIQRYFPNAEFFSMYGLTECKRTTYLPPRDLARKPGSVGVAIPGTRIEICDEYNYPLAVGQEGQVVVSGPHIMSEYLDLPEETQRVIFFDPLDKQRKLATGDYGYLDQEGYLYLCGRKDDVFKIDGRKYSCNEQETLLKSFDAISDCCVVVDDEVKRIYAFIVVEEGFSISDQAIKSGLLKHSVLSSHLPDRIVRLDGIPTNNNGKHDKKALRGRHLSSDQASSTPAPAH